MKRSRWPSQSLTPSPTFSTEWFHHVTPSALARNSPTTATSTRERAFASTSVLASTPRCRRKSERSFRIEDKALVLLPPAHSDPSRQSTSTPLPLPTTTLPSPPSPPTMDTTTWSGSHYGCFYR
ncbi:hypothetical protein CC1G_04440 [Coprinopsis cinerea okayama7|uniref:Uncharacterized protein n=1 Tax=Coprinopsis cinerea (strain Okayama-7 / 130 / ATCC MYA-4618 / FGSC 9003) TaxID=240176 RepID=A8N0L9_COPC7|nr:hypothetical protein CC1G_04440 [Coprinopsis cinerea okayama7\|eukprot:XP_001828469.2 hypothetical protein CC1G_04440 [Coprinopsis cinerea okayama7\